MKKNMRWVLYICIFLLLIFPGKTILADYIAENKNSWKPYYTDEKPDKIADKWFVPFKTKDRQDPDTIKIISVFGAHRNSYVKGHIHTGIDIIPENKRDYTYIDVYATANGIVCSIHLGHPHKTVIVKHKMPDDTIIFSSYKHLQEIYVENNQQVTLETKLARLYTRKEALAQGGRYDHLHLEIRKKFDDYGVASWGTITKEALNLRFYEPWKFIKKHVKKVLPKILVINPCIDKNNLSLVKPVIKAIRNIDQYRIITQHYKEVDSEKIKALSPGAIIITGQTTPWNMYRKRDLKEIKKVIKKSKIPILGICGGHQLIGLAFNMKVGLIKGDDEVTTYDNCFRLKGNIKMTVTESDKLLKGIQQSPKLYASHCEEIKKLNSSFKLLIKDTTSPVQMMKHKTKDIYGVQFHPEKAVPGDNSGMIILRHFINLAPE